MKLKAHQVDGFIKSPDPNILLVLVYGSDLGMIREHARVLANFALGSQLWFYRSKTATAPVLPK